MSKRYKSKANNPLNTNRKTRKIRKSKKEKSRRRMKGGMWRALGLADAPVEERDQSVIMPVLTEILRRLTRIEAQLGVQESRTLAPEESSDSFSAAARLFGAARAAGSPARPTYVNDWLSSSLRRRISNPQNPVVILQPEVDTDPKFEVYKRSVTAHNPHNSLWPTHYIRHRATGKTYQETNGFTR